MALLPADVPTGLITGEFWFVNEDSVDAGTSPDLLVVTGTVTFTASVPVLRMPSKPVSIIPMTFDAEFDSLGRLVPKGQTNVGIELPATNSALLSPLNYTWKVDFNLKEAATGFSVVIPSYSISVPAGSTQDLTTLMPVDTSPGTITIQGPKGDKGDQGPVGADGPPSPEAVAAAEAAAADVAKVAPVTFFVDNYTGSDADKWQAAINAAITFSGAATIQGGAKTYYFDKMVSVRGLVNATLRGHGNNKTVITMASGTGELQHLFYNPVAGGGVITNLVFEDFDIVGGMTAAPAGLARSARTFGANKVDTPIRINGNLVPGEGSAATVTGVTLRRVRIYGCEDLPASFRGCKQVTVNNCLFERTMDIGFTWCDGVTVTENVSLWSADNGFSISRGCKNIVVNDNRVYGSWYWGIWLAGFDINEGPQNFVCSGNEITHVGSGGITLDQGGRNGTIVGNTIVDCLRGGDGTSTYGIGIYLRGNPQTVPTWCENVVVIGNTIIDASRGGVLVRQLTRNIQIANNLVVRPGTNLDETGAVISSSDGFQNFGVAVPVSGTEVADGQFGPIDISGNILVDDRSPFYMNYGTFIGAGLDLIVSRSRNRWEGSRTSYGEFELASTVLALTVGRNIATDSQFKINGASGSSRALLLQAGGVNRAGFRFVSGNSSQLYLTTYTDAGTANDIATMDRDWHRMVFLRPPKMPTYTTGARPNASNFGEGSMIFDSTLKKPLWSNGTAWVDSTGTVV